MGRNKHQSVQSNTFEPCKIGTYRQIPEQSIFLTYCQPLFLNYSPNRIQNGHQRIGYERTQMGVRL